MRVEHDELPTQAYSDPLVGRTVRINKEGPEARTGVLLAVRCDFIALKTEEDGVVFYVTEHIRSISEDADDNLPQIPFSRHELDAVEEEDFLDLLHSLKHRYVRIDRGGAESRVGRLLHVGVDHLALFTVDDGVIYYNLEHIRSISEVHPVNREGDPALPPPTDPRFIRVRYLHELFHRLRFHWVKINRGGPDKQEGVLVEAKEDQITVVRDRRIHRISTFHLRNISISQPLPEQNAANGSDPSGSEDNRERGRAEGQERGQDPERGEERERAQERERVEERGRGQKRERQEREREREQLLRLDDLFDADDEEKEMRTRTEPIRSSVRQRGAKTTRTAAKTNVSTAVPTANRQTQKAGRQTTARSNASALSEIRGGRATRIYFMNH